jgi:hypothetical protein
MFLGIIHRPVFITAGLWRWELNLKGHIFKNLIHQLGIRSDAVAILYPL